MNKNILLLYSNKYPCWDFETVKLTGENPEMLEVLEKSGELEKIGNSYIITEKGIESRKKLSNENFVPVDEITKKISTPCEANENLEINRMTQYLDRAFMTEWGIKEFEINETFPIVPKLSDGEYFSIHDGHAKAKYLENTLIKSFMKEFPNFDYNSRKLPVPGESKLNEWSKKVNAPEGEITIDFVLRHRHDFEHYRQFARPENDRYKFVNASLIFAHKVRESPEELLNFIGKLHIFFLNQRRIFLPGWFDMDSEDQETMNILTFVTDTDSQLEKLTETLRKFGSDLIEPARPLFMTGTSIEHLRKLTKPKEMFYDWFAEETVKILRHIE